MKNIAKVWRSSTAFLLSAFSFLILITSCSNELDEALQPANNGTLQFVVSDFPTFGESTQTRVIGTQDEGKTAWANEDKILVHLYSQKYGDQAVTLTFDAENNTWESDGGTLSYLENETPTITAVYAPDCEIKSDKTIGLLEGKQYGEAEYILARTTISENSLDINFESGRTYSRLRIATMSNASLTVSTEGFTPAGANNSSSESGATRAAEEALNVLPCPKEGSTVLCATGARSVPQAEGSVTYTLTTDENGNAYLYGTFAEDATVTVKKGSVTLTDYTFKQDTEANTSYALDARPVIDGTLGGKTEATAAEVETLVQQLKDYVDNGITTIIVPGSKSAIIEVDGIVLPAASEAIYRLSKDESYNGKIDLILPDVTEIVDQEFDGAHALNSINLPKVTTVGDGAFYDCQYLEELTFGSVVTAINHNTRAEFHRVGEKVEGCDLVLNREQVNAEADYQPNIETRTWWNTEWKSITLK